jgi:hypothetical protein
MVKLILALERVKPSFIDGLDNQLYLYMTIGWGLAESPMWMQLNPSRNSSVLTFENSQKRNICFNVDVSSDDKSIISGCYDEAYDYFKYAKYVHIRDNYPTVWNELADGVNGERINNFLKSYQHGQRI